MADIQHLATLTEEDIKFRYITPAIDYHYQTTGKRSKKFCLAEVLWNGNVFIHKAVSTYFEENGVRAAYAREQGKVWDGPESIDDYC